MKQAKIIFIDLDGTLLNNKSEITTYTKEIIKRTQDKGIQIVICSGRANSDIIEKSKKYNVSSMIISSNGAMVFNYKNNKKIFESKIDSKALKDIWQLAEKNNISVTYNSTYKRFKNKKSNKQAIEIKNIEELEDNVTQIVVESSDYEKLNSMKDNIENKYNQLEVKNFWEQNNSNSKEKIYEMDIANKFNSKGKAIDKLLAFLEIDKRKSICFGDQMNDLSMFESCGIKVAMNNGNEKLKKKADYITSYTNNEDGVAKFIERYIL